MPYYKSNFKPEHIDRYSAYDPKFAGLNPLPREIWFNLEKSAGKQIFVLRFCKGYCEQSPSETPLCLLAQVYSMRTFTKSSECLNEIATGENRVGSKQRERERGREREREQWINGVRDRTLDRNGNGVGWKCPLVEEDT